MPNEVLAVKFLSYMEFIMLAICNDIRKSFLWAVIMSENRVSPRIKRILKLLFKHSLMGHAKNYENDSYTSHYVPIFIVPDIMKNLTFSCSH